VAAAAAFVGLPLVVEMAASAGPTAAAAAAAAVTIATAAGRSWVAWCSLTGS
jgi:hypothetical protein